MFNKCYECGGELKKQKGTVYGYWGDLEIEFTQLPIHKCSECNDVYLDEKTATLTQEITRALSDIGRAPEVVDVCDSYETLTSHSDEIYNIVAGEKVKLVEIGSKIIINAKDVSSLFHNNNFAIAARCSGKITTDVKREINNLKNQGEE